MRKREFTKEQIEFIRNGLQEMSTRKVAEAYTEFFGEPLGQTQLRRVCKRNNIPNPRPCRKPLPVGYERWSDYYQCYVIKVANISVSGMKPSKERHRLREKQWKLKQNYVWEQTHGIELPTDMVVVFLDGDRTNYDPKNLFAAPLENIGYVYRTKINSEFAPVMKSALICAGLAFANSDEATQGKSHENRDIIFKQIR